MLTRYPAALVVVFALPGPVDATLAQQAPSALRAMEESRRAIRSGRIEWSVVFASDAENERIFASSFAKNGDSIFEDRGDSQGRTMALGERPGSLTLPQLVLRNESGLWMHQETGPSVMWYTSKIAEPTYADEFVQDPRFVGIVPAAHSMHTGVGFAALWSEGALADMDWVQERSGDLHMVRGTSAAGVSATWEINASKGWNAERIEVVQNGVTYEAVCKLRQFGKTWLPESTEYFRAGKLVKTVRVINASVNNAGDSKEFTPIDLGIEPGMDVGVVDGRPEPREVQKWNGEAVVPLAEWLADVRTGRRTSGPIMQSIVDKGYWDSPYLTEKERREREFRRTKDNEHAVLKRHDRLWEKYVRDFVRRFELDEEQVQRANAVLAQCQERAAQFFKRNETALVASANAINNARTTGKRDELESAKKRLTTELKPIDDIFEKTLKPNLEKIPTRAQREKVGAPE